MARYSRPDCCGPPSFVFGNQLNWFTYNLLIGVAALGVAFISILLPGVMRTQFNIDLGQAAKLSAFGPLAVFAVLLWLWTGQAPALVGFCDLSGRWGVRLPSRLSYAQNAPRLE